jgi:hypothetical protein
MTKNWISILNLFDKKWPFTYPWPPSRTSKLQEKTSALKKKRSSTSKNEIYELLSAFVGHFCPPGSGSGSRYGSRDSVESRSNPDPQHWV